MKLQLTDAEVKSAISTYVSKRFGIDLEKNDIAMKFSATRVQGLVTKLDITDKDGNLPGTPPLNPTSPLAQPVGIQSPFVGRVEQEIPGYTTDTPSNVLPSATEANKAEEAEVVKATAEAVTGQVDTTGVTEAEPEAVTDVPAETPADTIAPEATVETKPKTTATLFGKPASAA